MKHIVLLAIAAIAACGSTTNTTGGDAGDVMTQGGPEFLSFGTNLTTMTSTDTATFVAVLTHPQGIADLVGGHLTDSTGAIQYGAFVADQQGSYSLSLSWKQIYQATSFQFDAQDQVEFVAEFFDVQGRRATKHVTLTLACPGATYGTCGGACFDFASDHANCGGCKKTCAQGTCGQNGCGGIDVVDSTMSMTCTEICAQKGGSCDMTCGGYDNNSNVAEYQCSGQPFADHYFACDQAPPATDGGCPIDFHGCCCAVPPQ